MRILNEKSKGKFTMAKNHQATRKDNSIKIAVIIFIAFIVIVGAALFINNRSLSWVASVDGERIPMAHFWYQYDRTAEQLWEFAWMLQPGDVEEIALGGLVDLYAVTARADEFGVELTREQIDMARSDATAIRAHMMIDGDDIIRQMGFTRSSFYSFVEMMALYSAVYDTIASRREVTEQEFIDGIAAYIEENAQEYRNPFAHIVETETEEEAEVLRERILAGESITDIMLELNEEANTTSVHVSNTNFFAETWEEAHFMNEGDISLVVPLANGMFGVYQIERIEYDEIDEEAVRETVEAQVRHAHFREFANMWAEQAEVVRNTRVLPYPQPSDFEVDWDIEDSLEQGE
ncbi:MAG: SurA N-terminal domain-containing protein [Defluviitaleaceae bacterium]|nr:SurA N-terminal domain-containing protein [Defluviitaleaceae bacterium]